MNLNELFHVKYCKIINKENIEKIIMNFLEIIYWNT